MPKQIYCEKCKKIMAETEFYTSNNTTKYPNGRLTTCKKCITMHVDNYDPETFKWILEEMDVPYIKGEWDGLLKKAQNSDSVVTPISVIGRYVGKMKLIQYRKYRYADSEKIAEEAKQKHAEALRNAGFTEDEIAEELAKDDAPLERSVQEQMVMQREADKAAIEQPSLELTDEDRRYLLMKWGEGYSVNEWLKMEKLYEDMMQSYDVQGAGHKDTLVLICKASLKANQLIDAADVDGFQKMSRVYDSLMKSGNFTAKQNKEETGEAVDSVGELVAMCEKEGFIPRYYTDGPQDKVDRTLQDLQGYTRSLVMDEMNLGNMIENAMKQIVEDKTREAQLTTDDGTDEDALEASLFAEKHEEVMGVDDRYALTDFEDEESLLDEEFFETLEKG